MRSVNSSLNGSPLGATVSTTGVTFGVWAPHRRTVEVEFDDPTLPRLSLAREAGGFFGGHSDRIRAGHLYRFRLDDTESHPDPYSRYQPHGPHGPSMVVDPGAYPWRDSDWQGLDPSSQVIYELHIGTFTEAGTYESAGEHLNRLRELGITCVEIMPVNEFVGRFGWGYDGVNWFAPYHHYGTPDALRAFIDRAHQVGLGVLLDVIYNHFGHEGNYLPRFADDYLTDSVKNPWGSAPDYACPAMRRLAIDNAAYWVREFHFDGLRLDAIQNIHDPQSPSLLSSIAEEARAAAGDRRIVISAEDYLQRMPLVGNAPGEGANLDLLWNDDFHHATRVALTGNHYGFFKNYRGTAQEIVSTLKRGFLFQGQYDGWSHVERGVPAPNEPLSALVAFMQNHDAIANTLDGQRIQSLVDPGNYRALTAALLLGPQTPLIFMGQEFGASTPFSYFADYPSDSVSLLKGRQAEAAQFLPYQDPAATARIRNPTSVDTFKASVLNHDAVHSATLRLVADLLRLRRRFSTVCAPQDVDGATLGEYAFVFRWLGDPLNDRLLLVNLGPQLEPRAWPEPLLAAPRSRRWAQIWSSEAPDYGGMGTIPAITEAGWQLSAHCACLLQAQ